MEGVKLDRWGYQVRTSSDSCISAINAYYHQVLSYGRERRVILQAPQHDKDCVLANILAAHFLSSSDSSKASSHLQAAKSRLDEATSYEKAVFDAVSYLISEDRDPDVAVELHSKLLKKFPRDLGSLKRAQVLCFYMGRPDLCLDIVKQVLPYNQLEDYIYGILAFALLELGRMTDAEVAARKGFEINKQDFWSQHALCHVLQYECRFTEVVQFMEECASTWSSCSSFMYTHNWWHIALCYLEGHSAMKKVLEVYDNHIWKELEKPDAVSPEVYLNALGLLLRVYVRGELDVFGDRLKILAGCVTDQANWHLEWHLDLLILWALAVTGELSKAEDLLKGLKSRLEEFSSLLAEAVYEYGKGNDKKALELLDPDFDASLCKMIGASDEQLDVFNEVWYNMLLNTAQAAKAIEVLEQRIKKREGAPFMWRLLERAYSMEGREEAATVGEKARKLEAAYFK
ncbi:Tetratricopeptide repeat 38 [Melia azedarach]|uniref:Tetratricopeptide repeat 38 n=1 Tax=Melia azedarach TaxID=155640 RepID=A0ACC1XK54_MELAZ|nr:Tetratricopeptide repeat 38 [Melia azedarach]